MERFVIVSDFDNPYPDLVAEWVEGMGYCYMSRERRPELKKFDGMNPKRPTPLSAFGFVVDVRRAVAVFVRTGECTATYADGKPRRWCGSGSAASSFALPLVVGVRRRGSIHAKRLAEAS